MHKLQQDLWKPVKIRILNKSISFETDLNVCTNGLLALLMGSVQLSDDICGLLEKMQCNFVDCPPSNHIIFINHVNRYSFPHLDSSIWYDGPWKGFEGLCELLDGILGESWNLLPKRGDLGSKFNLTGTCAGQNRTILEKKGIVRMHKWRGYDYNYLCVIWLKIRKTG